MLQRAMCVCLTLYQLKLQLLIQTIVSSEDLSTGQLIFSVLFLLGYLLSHSQVSRNNRTVAKECVVLLKQLQCLLLDSRAYSVSLRTETYSADLSDASFTYTIVDCGYNRNCTSCTESASECGWCLYDSVCTADNTNCYMQEWVQVSSNMELII